MKILKGTMALLLAAVMLLCAFPVSAKVDYDHTDHTDLALTAVTEGIVLLKNDNGALPLEKNEKIALFGGGQIYTASTTSGYQIGGGGSGWVSSVFGTPMGPADALLEAEKQGKVSVYKPLYDEYRADVNYIPDDTMYANAAAYADTAIMFITRYSTEGSDISVSEWELTDAEKAMMKKLSDSFETVAVILNTPSVIDTDWSLDGNSLGVDVDALLACYMGGQKGGEGMTQILTGEVNPSGKLTHTYAKDIYDYPTTATFLENNAYVNYTEDIYVGYRYFETFSDAKDLVVYPFGYGLSYTDFEMSASPVTVSNRKVTVSVTVRNTGPVAGKEVVQVYYSAPQAGNGSAVLSKSAISLATYAKTKLLSPGESQTLTLSYDLSDMASFDDTGKTGNANCYVLEAGSYDIRVGNSVRNTQSAGSYTVDSLTVVSRHERLLPTTLANRLTYDGSYETLPKKPEKTVNVVHSIRSDKLSWIEAETGKVSEGSGINTTENFGKNGYIYDGSKWIQLGGGTVLGNMNGNKQGHTVIYKFKVAKAGKYKVGFVLSNGTDKTGDANDVLEMYVNGSKQSVPIDVENTRNAGTGQNWFNFKFKAESFEGNAYELELPAGEVTFTLCVAANTAATPNIDKFVLIPEGMTCTVADALANYDGSDIETEIDIYRDSYKRITYSDVESGKATLKELIAQMSYNELIGLCYGHEDGITDGTGTIGFASNVFAEKYGIYSADTADGPAGLRLSSGASIATFWPCATLQACTWNTELLTKIGETIGDECLKYNADIWLAPGINIHRNPLCGRNFEYYSEDPVVSGRSAAALINGVESKGVGCAIKHFALNNKEANRKNSDSRVSEKAMREIYLKGFEIAIRDADPMCVMTSYNLVNGLHTSANADLIKGILRGEWGYKGLIMSDWNTVPSNVSEVLVGNNVKMPYGSGSPTDLEKAVKNGLLRREVLEENAMYILNTLVKLPDHTVHAKCVNEISAEGITTISADKYSKKAYQLKFDLKGDDLCASHTEYVDEITGSRGFIEFTVSVNTPGIYSLCMSYATKHTVDSAFYIWINGKPVSNIDNNVIATGAWDSFSDKMLGEIHLDKGISTVRIQQASGLGVNYYTLSTLLLEADKPHEHSFGAWESVDPQQHKQTCECGEERVEAHKWNDGEITAEATTEAEGETKYTCTECQLTRTEVIPMLEPEVTPDPPKKADNTKIITIIAISVGSVMLVSGATVAAAIIMKKKRSKK